MNNNFKFPLFYRFNKITGYRSLDQLFEAIRKNHFKEQIDRIRSLKKMGKVEEAQKMKKHLPAFTPSGVFKDGRTIKHLIHYTQYIVLDFDGLHTEELERLKRAAPTDQYSIAGFTSPSGNGYKIFTRVSSSADQHKAAFRQVADWYEQQYQVTPDPSGKDITRLCFLSHDPQAWLQAAKAIFQIVPPPVKETTVRKQAKSNGRLQDKNFDQLSLKELFVLTQSKLNYIVGNRNNFLYQFANYANRAGHLQNDTLSFACQQFDDLAEAEIQQTINSAYHHNAHEHNTFSKRHNNNLEDDPSPTLGGDLDTFFPDLPALLRNGSQMFENARERDVFLTGALAILSGCIRGVQGVYDGRKTYCNLYAFIVAPPASGKSALRFAKDLGALIHDNKIQEYKKARTEYKSALAEYKRTLDLNKKKDPLPKVPEEPSFKILYIPANSSSAMVIKHLQDNDNFGIICETEADSLTNALKQDWGGYSDLLRKAFHFERISYSRKNNLEYCEINEPRLSVAISGTPNQVFGLIPSVEDGLFSRFIFYCFGEGSKWRDVSPQNYKVNLNDHFAKLSHTTLELREFTDQHPFNFDLKPEQWQQLNQRFEEIYWSTGDYFGRESLSSIKRLGAILYRIAMILTACRRFEEKKMDSQVFCGDIDFKTAFTLVETYIQHALFIYEHLPKKDNHKLRGYQSRKYKLYKSLPSNFKRKEAIQLGKNFSMSTRTIDRFLALLVKKELLVQKEYGNYTKVAKWSK